MKKFAAPFQKSIFVCTQKRPDGHPKPCCADRGGMALRQELRDMAQEKGKEMEIRVFTSGCIGACDHGPVAIEYPNGEYVLGITKEDLPEILDGLME
ncbi:MAG: (2Fe-2S) ferredoxin domain-containing protein [bacterium]|nr:(2Fe-2S) ferredoxin domain-containing protein [bacterium]